MVILGIKIGQYGKLVKSKTQIFFFFNSRKMDDFIKRKISQNPL